MYTSTDGGLTFAQTAGADATTVLPGGGEMNLTTVPGVAGEVWAAGGDTEGDGDGVYGLFRSTDGGNSWEELAGFDAARSEERRVGEDRKSVLMDSPLKRMKRR